MSFRKDPFHDWDGDHHALQVRLAEQDVEMYTEFAKHSRWRWHDQLWLWWFPFFAVTEFAIGVWNVLDGHWWGVLYGLGIPPVMMYMWRRNRAMKQERLKRHDEWIQKRDDAIAKLESLDPTNVLVPEIIEEEP